MSDTESEEEEEEENMRRMDIVVNTPALHLRGRGDRRSSNELRAEGGGGVAFP